MSENPSSMPYQPFDPQSDVQQPDAVTPSMPDVPVPGYSTTADVSQAAPIAQPGPQMGQVPQYGQAPQYQQVPMMPNQTINIGGMVVAPGNGMAVASMVLGIVAILFAFVPLIGVFIAFPCALLAFIFGIIGMVRGSRIQKNFGMGLCGLILSIIASIMMSLGGGWLW